MQREREHCWYSIVLSGSRGPLWQVVCLFFIFFLFHCYAGPHFSAASVPAAWATALESWTTPCQLGHRWSEHEVTNISGEERKKEKKTTKQLRWWNWSLTGVKEKQWGGGTVLHLHPVWTRWTRCGRKYAKWPAALPFVMMWRHPWCSEFGLLVISAQGPLAYITTNQKRQRRQTRNDEAGTYTIQYYKNKAQMRRSNKQINKFKLSLYHFLETEHRSIHCHVCHVTCLFMWEH